MKYGFASHLAADRKELAEALQIAPDIDSRGRRGAAGMASAMRIDLRGRITARTGRRRDADPFAMSQRKETANLICLWIDSPGGPAAPALRLVHLLAGLDSQTAAHRRLRGGRGAVGRRPGCTGRRRNLCPRGCDPGRAGRYVYRPGRTADDAAADPGSWPQTKNRDWSLLLGLVDPQLKVFRCTPGRNGRRALFLRGGADVTAAGRNNGNARTS